jgi:hypothetical protein
MEEPAYHLDIEGLGGPDAADSAATLRGRPWIGIHFDCCGTYTRIYRNPEGTAYNGFCPRCGRKVRLKVGPGGTDARFFVAE